MNSDIRDPYKVFFPLGVFSGAIGVLFWSIFSVRWIEFYPRESHGNLMFFGMFWPFVIGFLMTAIPRMTNTKGPSYLEVSLAILLVFCQIVVNLRNLIPASEALFGLQALIMLAFIIRRFWISRRIPFAGFIFLPLAFALVMVGVFLFIFSGAPRETVLLLAGEGFLMNLVLGLGSRLIPMISRMPAARPPSESQVGESWLKPVTIALILNLGYAAEVSGFATIGRVLRLVSVVAASVLILGLLQRPLQWSVSGIGFKLALFFILLGQAFVILGGGLPAQHLVYIGGFGMITLLVSTRVVLAHAGAELVYEISSWKLGVMVLSLALAGVLRWLSGWGFGSGISHAAVAAFCAGLALWMFRFLTIENPKGQVDCK